jgi:hypothetical protein
MVNIIMTISDPYRPSNLVYSKRRRNERTTSITGMVHTKKGVHDLGSGWLFIWSVKFLKSRNLLKLAYRKSPIINAQTNSINTCFLGI